ncbi:MAG: hypothetical protein ACTS9Y_00195 [Methylophilus sp.]|uniref:hypothetical protein n=1 Tax=Methylophilus sp. TaxID=29541 RepID=UPI003FA0CEC7
MQAKFITVKSMLEKLLVDGAVIRIGKQYAETSTQFEEGQLITLKSIPFELDDGFGAVQNSPAVWNETTKEWDSIYHIWDNDLSLWADNSILDTTTERSKGPFVVDTNTPELPYRVYSESSQGNIGFFLSESDAELYAMSANRVDWDKNTFQVAVQEWVIKAFGQLHNNDKASRIHRAVEELLELAQSLNCTKEEVLQLVDYVFSRPVGEPKQELGGVMLTAAALANAFGMDMYECALTELARVNVPEIIEKIRRKEASKPKFSALPGSAEIIA